VRFVFQSSNKPFSSMIAPLGLWIAF